MADTQQSSDDKLFGALAYISIISIIMYVLKKNNTFVAFHARQGMVLFIASLLWFIPVLGWIAALLAYVGMVIGFIKAYNGEKYEMPFVKMLAEKINF